MLPDVAAIVGSAVGVVLSAARLLYVMRRTRAGPAQAQVRPVVKAGRRRRVVKMVEEEPAPPWAGELADRLDGIESQLARAGGTGAPPDDVLGAAVRLGVTILLLGTCLFVVLSAHYRADTEKWAFGVIGTILGFWLPGRR